MSWFERPVHLWIGTLLIAAAAFTLLLQSGPARAAPADGETLKTESPFFAVQGAAPGVDALPLKGTRVDVQILGPIAEVRVEQTYRNEGQVALEARHVFPGGARAAVHAMDVRLADRLLVAQIREKQQARIEFDAAKKEGRTAALLEQQRPNVFEMNVANILPGDEVKVSLRYTELLVPRDGRYEFVYPTVVGPRYNSPRGEAAAERWVAQPTLRAGVPSNAAFALRIELATPLPARDIASPSHALDVVEHGARRFEIALREEAGRDAANRDFVLRYGLGGEGVASGVLLQRDETGKDGGEGGGHFVALVQPPQVVAPAAVLPREYVFVVDISGSMHGFPLDTAKALMQRLLGDLRPSDRFNVMLFSGSARTLSSAPVPATQANVAAALRLLRETGGGGGTEIVPALEQVAAMPKHDDVSRTVVVVTDGYVAVEKRVFQLVRRELGRSNVFAFGIGSSVNRHLIEGIARAGQGEAFVVTKPEQAAAEAERFRRMIESPVLTQVTARFEGGLQALDVEPAHLPDVLGGRPVLLTGRWRGVPQGVLVVEGRNADGPQRLTVDLAQAQAREGAALRLLWARERIAALGDEEAIAGGQPHKAAITALGLRHGLLTDYTSFIAVDRVVRNPNPALARSVQQPLPLPEGVSELALSAEVPTTPEPALWGAALVMLGVLGGMLAWRRRGERRAGR